jgi:hypothetical protein
MQKFCRIYALLRISVKPKLLFAYLRWSLNQYFFYQWIFNAGSVKNQMCRQLILPSTAQNALRQLCVSNHWRLGPTWDFAGPLTKKNPGYASGRKFISYFFPQVILPNVRVWTGYNKTTEASFSCQILNHVLCLVIVGLEITLLLSLRTARNKFVFNLYVFLWHAKIS